MILGIYGAGGVGREILDLARVINAAKNSWDKIVFINDFKKESYVNGAEVFTFDEFKTSFTVDNAKITIAVGEPKVRRLLREKVTDGGYKLQTLIHPNAFVGTATIIGDGTIIQFGTFVSCNVKIGENVLLEPCSKVSHDSVVGNDAVISAYVVISGNCTVGELSYVGISVAVRENISIGGSTIIGMGSAVLRDIPENVVAFGNPARVMKSNVSGRVFK